MLDRKLALPFLLLVAILTITALSCGSVSGLPNPFASATPTPTETFTPTVTPSPTPSPTPTFTPTSTPIPTGVDIQDLPGGGSRFLDYDGRYLVEIPAEWLAIKADPADMQAAMSNLASTNPGIAEALKNLPQSQYSYFRIIAYDKQDSHYMNGFAPNINVVLVADRLSAAVPLNALVTSSLDQIKVQFPGAKTEQLDAQSNAHGVPIASAEIKVVVNTGQGPRLALYEKQLYFQTKKGVVVITLAALQANAQLIVPSFDKIFDRIELMQP